jgi:hypothetical protein
MKVTGRIDLPNSIQYVFMNQVEPTYIMQNTSDAKQSIAPSAVLSISQASGLNLHQRIEYESKLQEERSKNRSIFTTCRMYILLWSMSEFCSLVCSKLNSSEKGNENQSVVMKGYTSGTLVACTMWGADCIHIYNRMPRLSTLGEYAAC